MISVRIACNIISASSEPRAAGCHVTLAGGMELFMLDESLLYNGGGGFSKAKDVSAGRTIVQVLKGIGTGFDGGGMELFMYMSPKNVSPASSESQTSKCPILQITLRV